MMAHPDMSQCPVSMSQVSLFLQWLQVLLQSKPYRPVSQPKEQKVRKKLYYFILY